MNNRWLAVMLAVSLAINLLLGGFVAGRLSGFDPHGPGFDPVVGLTRALRSLPDDRRREVMGERGERRAVFQSIRELRQVQDRIRQALAAEPFDAKALEKALGQFRAKLAESQAKSHQALLDVVTRLTPAERKAMVEALGRTRPPQPPDFSERPPHH